MCGRFGLEQPEFSEKRFQAELLPDVNPATLLAPRYNIAPTQEVLTVALSKRLGGRRGLKPMVWGLTHEWALRDRAKPRPINIRTETIEDHRAFRSLLVRNRCLIPAGFFFEWQRLDRRARQAYCIQLRSSEQFAFAGVWTAVKDGEEWLVSCAILTTRPNNLVAQLHNRQPVMLTPEQEAVWLDPDVTDAGELMPLLEPLPASLMDMYPVSNLVNNVANDGPELRKPAQPLDRQPLLL